MPKNLRAELIAEAKEQEKAWAERTTFAEQRLIVALLTTGDVGTAERVDEGLFGVKFRPMVRWIRDQGRQHGELPDLDALRFKFPDFEPMPAHNSVGFYLQWLRDEDRRGRVAGLAGGVLDAIRDGKTPDEALAELLQRAQRLQSDTGDTGSDSGIWPLTRNGDRSDSSDKRHVGSVWTADALVAAIFPEPRFAVPGLVPEGATVFVGPPKVGKSWLALGLGLAVASGEKALGRIDVEPGPVLYLALEDTPRRLQTRLRVMLGDEPAPAGLTIWTTCPPLPDGGAERIGAWLESNPTARLVVIDVFARMRGPAPFGVSAYDADYAAVARVKALADKFGVALVLVHHSRKAKADDFLETVSGTNGLTGAADAVVVLKRPRGNADGLLQVTGRDVEEAEHALKFDAKHGRWELLEGPAQAYTLSDTRASILRQVTLHGPAKPQQLADALQLPANTVRKTCLRMVEDGQLDTDGNGVYRRVTPVTSPGQDANSTVTPSVTAVTRIRKRKRNDRL